MVIILVISSLVTDVIDVGHMGLDLMFVGSLNHDSFPYTLIQTYTDLRKEPIFKAISRVCGLLLYFEDDVDGHQNAVPKSITRSALPSKSCKWRRR